MTITFDSAQLFTYAEDIITALMPIVYVVGGIGLGFVVINKIISSLR